jgi:uncharacterized protein YndB with AHSA1/START domain
VLSTVTHHVNASPDQVWEVLADGWLYPLWVVGATRMRSVDDGWPSEGTRLHHSAGVWPAVINDETSVLEADPGRSLRLRAAGWPFGEAEVVITLAPDGAGTEVTIEENATAGPGTLMPKLVQDRVVDWRNAETLRRLAFVVEGRTGG